MWILSEYIDISDQVLKDLSDYLKAATQRYQRLPMSIPSVFMYNKYSIWFVL